ncbi:dipeptidase [Acidobacteriota bacterium]
MKIRTFFQVFPILFIVIFVFATCNQTPSDIHEQVLTVDTHVDTPISRPNGFHITKLNDINSGGGQVDFPRMKKGGLDAICYAIFLSQGNRTPEDFQKYTAKAEKDFDEILEVIKAHPDLVELALTPEDAYRIEKTGKRILFLSIENGYTMGVDLSHVQKYYDYGLRLSGLCHGETNEICDSCTDEPEHDGLSEMGEKVVAEMNRLGIVVDVSHISDEAFYDVIKVSKTPIVASHSCARSLCESRRNMTDDMLEKLAKNGGVIQLCLLSSFIKKVEQSPQREEALKALREKYENRDQSVEERNKYYADRRELEKKYPQKHATVADAVDHIDHIVELIGIDHVGIGTDFDGGGGLKGCMDASEVGNVTKELVKRGYSEDQIRKIWGGNFMRVMQQVQDFAKEHKNPEMSNSRF